MVEYAIGKIEDIVCSTKYITIEEVMIDVVDRYICINDAMGPVKSQQSDKQGDEKDSKKKGDKSALLNPALKSGSIICQICQLEHSVINCPLVKELENQSAVRRGELFPGKSDKDG